MIESMEVLKDAASAAIYGAQAGNGVVIITTKNGQKGQAHITYNLKAAVQSLGKKSDLFRANDYIEYHKYLGDLSDAELEQKAYKTGFVDTDWYDEVFDSSMSWQHNITVEGGNDKGRFLVGLGLVDNNGIVKGDKDTYRRFTVQLNAEYKFFNWLSVTNNTSVEKWKRLGLQASLIPFCCLLTTLRRILYGTVPLSILWKLPVTRWHVATWLTPTMRVSMSAVRFLPT